MLHATTQTHYIETKYIRKAIEKIGKKYNNFEYIEKQGLPVNELHLIISSCDLIIDQLIVGYYGLFSVESMAMGKPVVVYIRPDIWEKEKSYSPVFNANPDTIFETLEKILIDPAQLEKKGKESRVYVEKFHDASTVAKSIYQKLNSK
jgi:glycosyltransferase involved in cell wall biosynthesis